MMNMQTRGHEIHWIVLDNPKFYIPGVRIHSKIKVFQKALILRTLLLPYHIFHIRKLLRKIDPDILHAINIEWAGWLSVLSGFKNVLVTAQGGDVMSRADGKYELIKKWLRFYTLKNAKVVTYGNDNMLNAINKWAKPVKTVRIFAGVDFDKIKNRKRDMTYKRNIGVENRQVVFSPRTMVPNSNIDIIIRTIPIVKKEIKNVVYLFTSHVDNKDYLSKMIKLAEDLRVIDNCVFLNRLNFDDMLNCYSISKIVISILTSDGMPATLLESMAMKKILIITKIPSYSEIIDGKLAIAVNHRDVQQTADAVINILKPEKETTKIAELAYQWVKENADNKKINETLDAVYDELLNEKYKN